VAGSPPFRETYICDTELTIIRCTNVIPKVDRGVLESFQTILGLVYFAFASLKKFAKGISMSQNYGLLAQVVRAHP
jgi:hypothetical protein